MLAPAPASRPGHQQLVVLLHACMLGPGSLQHVRDAVETSLPEAHILAPRLPLETFSTADPASVAREIVSLIDHQVSMRQQQGWPEFSEIILIGHSLGALLARKACRSAAARPSSLSCVSNGSHCKRS